MYRLTTIFLIASIAILGVGEIASAQKRAPRTVFPARNIDEYCFQSSASMYFRVTSPGPWYRHIRVKSGSGCRAIINNGGVVTGIASPVEGLTTVMRFNSVTLMTDPKHGKAALRQSGEFDYRAESGFIGQDTFDIRICGTEGSTPGCATLRYTVDIY